MASGFSDDVKQNFGDGDTAGGRNWTPPVHGNVKDDGTDVTVSQGQNNRGGHTLISSGHSSAQKFYARDEKTGEKGHAHFGPKGEEYHGSPNYKG